MSRHTTQQQGFACTLGGMRNPRGRANGVGASKRSMATNYHALNVVLHSTSKGLHSCTHPNCDQHCAEAHMQEKTYTLKLHVPVLGSSIVLSSHLATLKTNTPHSATAACTGLKNSLQPAA